MEIELIFDLLREFCEINNASQPGPISAVPVPSTTPLEQLNQGASSLVYSPISNDQIRLVKIQPGDDDQIACFLETVDRDKAPAYRVLSYVWGSQGDPKTILLNNQPWKVTRNLEEVLRRLQETPSHQRIWIDALSINQSDIPERNAQVIEMRQIYSSASVTILWLGTNQDPSISKLIEMEIAQEGIGALEFGNHCSVLQL